MEAKKYSYFPCRYNNNDNAQWKYGRILQRYGESLLLSIIIFWILHSFTSIIIISRDEENNDLIISYTYFNSLQLYVESNGCALLNSFTGRANHS